jgi:hypothetical protein
MMYKIQGGLVPPYLHNACPPLTRDRTTYNLRSAMDVTVPQTRTTTYQKSFFPQTIKDWNMLSQTVREIKTIDSFKELQNKKCGYHLNTLYQNDSSRQAINHTRIRLGLSGLAFQRFSYKHIDNPQCNNCSALKEDPIHYLLLCPAYANHREEFLTNVMELLNLNNIEIDFLNLKSRQFLVEIILNGTPLLSELDNRKVFQLTQSFIKNTGRFP